ncbi:MAG: cardiolipin synthase ClsB, partial [Lysobacteraceae bacterium]
SNAARETAGTATALFLPRDNGRRSDAIEDEYRRAIAAARREVLIANAYFFPGFGFLRALRQAARRGVRVALVLQGEPDTRIARTAARLLYRRLLDDGIRVFEYRRRPFHGKVAVIDRRWATVGSSNLDPLSLSLNLEANLFVRDAGFAGHLQARLLALIGAHCHEVRADSLPPRSLGAALLRPVAFHCLRHFPEWAGLLPAHTPRVAQLRDPARGRFGRAA